MHVTKSLVNESNVVQGHLTIGNAQRLVRLDSSHLAALNPPTPPFLLPCLTSGPFLAALNPPTPPFLLPCLTLAALNPPTPPSLLPGESVSGMEGVS